MNTKILLSLLLFLSFPTFSQTDDDSIKVKIIGTWRMEEFGNCVTFGSAIAEYHICDSAVGLYSSWPYTVRDRYIIVTPHPLEETYYRVRTASENEMIVDIYHLKLKKEDFDNEHPSRIRLKKYKSRVKFVKI